MALHSLMTYLVPHNEMEENTSAPKKYEGYMLKRRKWPLKGWHKRFFVLEKGFMKYAKSPHDIVKGKLHGILDVGLSVLTTQKKACRIDLDAEDTIFHLKIKSQASFHTWVSEIRTHREYRQAEMKNDSTLLAAENNDSHVTSPKRRPLSESELSPESTAEECAANLSAVQSDIENLRKLLQGIKTSSALWSPMKPPIPQNTVTLSKKERKMSKKASKKLQKAGSMCAPASTSELPSLNDGFRVPTGPVLPIVDQNNLSKSNPDITMTSIRSSSTSVHSALSSDNTTPPRPQHFSKSVHSTPTHANQAVPSFSFSIGDDSNNNLTPEERFGRHEQFLDMASKVFTSLESMLESLVTQEQNQNLQMGDNLRKAVQQLTKENKEITKENKDLKYKLQMISQISLSVTPMTGSTPVSVLTTRKSTLHPKMLGSMPADSQLSISETMSDMFYDAEEYLLSDEEGSSTDDEMSENDDDEDAGSTDAEFSEGESTSLQSIPLDLEAMTASGRRTKLPCFRPEGGDFSLWNILRKNIGKDLSKVSMPVTLNEPLNALQCLCEELEYSDLLDKAVLCEDPYERMVLVAAFAVSSYASTYTRAGQKPFNPLLGETYECDREDKGFKFVAEQVSHHPPISACHCSSNTYEFWQDARWKNKFWGKSMEILPMGSVHLKIQKYNDEYKWNKVTTCVHNIMSGTRWVEHYGEMIITNKDITCKINFSKSGYWNSKNGEIAGTVTDGSGEARQHMHGRWFESIYTGTRNKAKCIWRKSSMPTDYEKYYGFTQFAMELNELETADVNSLPRTDTRFRPDQRYLEEGNIEGAEKEKQRIEQLQRDRKKQRDENKQDYAPMFFKKVQNQQKNESWIFNEEYWRKRRDPGFVNSPEILSLW